MYIVLHFGVVNYLAFVGTCFIGDRSSNERMVKSPFHLYIDKLVGSS